MNELNRTKFQETIITYGFFIAIALIIQFWNLSRALFVAMFLISFYSFFKNKYYYHLSLIEKVVFYSSILFLISSIATSIFNMPYSKGWVSIHQKYIYLTGIIPLAYYFKQIKLNSKVLFWSISVLILSSFIYAIWQAQSFDQLNSKMLYWIDMNSLIFSMIICTATLMMFIYALKNNTFLSWLMTALGIVPIYLLYSRGTWLTFVTCIILFTLFNNANLKKRLIILITLVIGLGIASQVPNFQNRINKSIKNFNSSSKTSSVGIRLEMYRVAWESFKDKPILGNGMRVLIDKDFRKKIKLKYNANESILNSWHFHNQYLEILATRGIVGILTYIFLILSLIVYFAKTSKQQDYKSYGLIIISSYMIINLTEVTFEHPRALMFFVLTISALISLNKQAIEYD